jgi:hypothetical protein
MNDTSHFFIDVVNSMPAGSEWMVQAPDEEFLEAIREIPHLVGKVYIALTLKEEYRKASLRSLREIFMDLFSTQKLFWEAGKFSRHTMVSIPV